MGTKGFLIQLSLRISWFGFAPFCSLDSDIITMMVMDELGLVPNLEGSCKWRLILLQPGHSQRGRNACDIFDLIWPHGHNRSMVLTRNDHIKSTVLN